uniref:Seven TM Receptor n=1 Tax=Caenorhabditis japonica TaxID=281687 RepID=A0A8R1HNR7_CAEJA
MAFTANFEIFYAILDYLVNPIVSSVGNTWFVIRLNNGLSPEFSLIILILWCAMFGASQAIFAVHFFYRYAAIHIKVYIKYVEGKKIVALFIIPILIGLNDTALKYLCFFATPDNREYLRNYVYKFYGETIEKTSYICAKMYFEKDVEGMNGKINMKVLFGMLNLSAFVLVSMLCVLLFGFKTYRKISSQLKVADSRSSQTIRLQNQFFYALVAQTIIPLIFMYIPATMLFSSVIFYVDEMRVSSLVSYTITLYPVVDPLPTIFIIKRYRDTVLETLKSCFTCFFLSANNTSDPAKQENRHVNSVAHSSIIVI